MAYYAKAYLMKKLDEISALQIVFGNIRRKRRKENLVTIAKAFECLVKHYGSQKAVAEKVGISRAAVSMFLKRDKNSDLYELLNNGFSLVRTI